ncbi:hypothetical protein B7463_g2553, partial [Scytalidium lignicola]
MSSAREDGKTQANSVQEIDSIINATAVRDFAYTASSSIIEAGATPTMTDDEAVTFLSSSASTTAATTSDLRTGTENANNLPYTTFYDPSWTLSESQIKIYEPRSPVLPKGAGLSRESTQNGVGRRISDRSHTSEYSTYSTTYSSRMPRDLAGLYEMPHQELKVLESTSEDEIVSNIEAGTHARHESDSKYSQYSTYHSLDIDMEQDEISVSGDVNEEEERASSRHLTETSSVESGADELHRRNTIIPQKTPLFRQSKISIAVDVSGSTYGTVIEAEVKAIRSICSLFPSSLRSAIKILPWSAVAEYPIGLEDLDQLDPNGDTDPNALLHDDACRYELQNSSFWFLMTDGDIFPNEVRTFARNLVEYGLHGLASVVAIFGERESTPSKCNISVGLSIFAVSPHCAFLYTDVETGQTYILQTKGCFTALLPKGKSNPRLDTSTLWEDLPQTSYENLARVPIPPPQSVSKDEVILKDNSRLNISALLSNPAVDPETASRILDHEDNMKTIALTAKLKGQSEQFRKWLDAVEKVTADTLNPDKIERPQTDSSNLLTEAVASLMKTEKSENTIADVQRQIREANLRDSKALEVMEQSVSLQAHRRSSSGRHARRVSSSNLVSAEDNIGSVDYDTYAPYYPRADAPSLGPRPLSVIPQTPGIEGHHRMSSLMNPGFRKPDVQRDFYKGTCMLCASNELVMALVLKKPPENFQSATANFPPPGSFSHLRYPLTMGNYPETDIIMPLLACDPCSFRLARKGCMPSGEKISAVLPVLSFLKNRAAWLETINIATQKRFSTEDLPLVFLAILYTKLERLLEERDSRAESTLRPALNWACSTLLQEIQPTNPESPMGANLGSEILKMFHSTLDNPESMDLLTYPVDGFIVANVALSNSHYKTKISAVKRQRIIFYRFLYHLAEQYFKLSVESGDMVCHATMMLLLLIDERAGPRSLLTLETLRQFSVHFKNRQEMMQALQTGLNWRPRKYKPKKLSISVKDLLNTPFLDAQSLRSFQRLGSLFTWIEDKAAHAIAAFLHFLHCIEKTEGGASERFVTIRKRPEMSKVISTPEEMSAKKVEDLIKEFPPVL